MKIYHSKIFKITVLGFILSYLQMSAETLQISENGSYGSFKDMEVTISGSAEIHLTDNRPLENASINFIGDKSLLILENVKPSVVAADYLKAISIDGEEADINKNVRGELYCNGAAIIPHGYEELAEALTVYSEPDCTGAERKFAAQEKSGDLGTFDNNIRSFRLKRGFQVCFANNPDGTGHSRVYIADKEDLVINELPDGFVTTDGSGKSFISFIRVERHHWTNKKIAYTRNEVPLINASSCYGYFESQLNLNTSDYECVFGCDNVKREYTARQVKDLSGISVLIGQYLPDQHLIDGTTSPEAAVRSWPAMFTAGVRTGAPAVSEKAWIKRFFEMIDSLNYRVDFTRLYHKFNNRKELESDINYMLSAGNDRPLWITELAFDQDQFSGETFSQTEDLLNQTLERFDQNKKIERFRIAGLRREDDQTVLTPLGEVYRDFNTGLSYSESDQYEHLWHIAPPTAYVFYISRSTYIYDLLV